MTNLESNSLIELDDAAVHFSQSKKLTDLFRPAEVVQAVDGVSLSIDSNEVLAIVGESGCGKTTLGKTIIGAQKPTDGTVSYKGVDMWDLKENTRGSNSNGLAFKDIRRALQIIHQDPGSALNPNRKVIASLMDPLKKWESDLTENDRKARILSMLERVGMTPAKDYAYRYPHQLSGGEKQRVVLIRSLLMSPDLILADEAISALDVSLRVEMMDLMLELKDQFSTSFVFISHDLTNARYLAENANGRIAVMYLGEIVEIGPAEEIVTNPRHPYTKALNWATPELEGGDVDMDEKMPMRGIDIPDPVNPPTGCRFHTRCPEAREACMEQDPALFETGNDRNTRCFRVKEDHEYWESPEITEN